MAPLVSSGLKVFIFIKYLTNFIRPSLVGNICMFIFPKLLTSYGHDNESFNRYGNIDANKLKYLPSNISIF